MLCSLACLWLQILLLVFFLIFGSGSVVLVLLRCRVISTTATSLTPMANGIQLGYRRQHYALCFILRLSGGGVRGDTTIVRPFILNPHVFDDKGKVIANARKGKLIALIYLRRPVLLEGFDLDSPCIIISIRS